ncbi:hypothetical protein BRD56_08270 [Thermoplasmatales archaeon SW_10_69_26]|nr:MAG: hypothetical protein BRD56_08270 [Thermoplasmatales archaeon SW_10_69_26]
MPRRAYTILAVVVLLTAGCLGAGPDPVSENADDSEEAPEGDGSSDRGSSDEGSSDDRSSEEDASDDNETSAGSDDSSSGETRSWPDPDEASIRPGVQVTGTGQCTSNFLYRTPDNATLMLGVAAHCVADAPQLGSNGCSDQVDPLEPGAQVDIEGASQPGVLVYSSWFAMQAANVTDTTICNENDFALVAIDPADRSKVHPAVRGVGGPTGLASDVAIGDEVRWYGSTSASPRTTATSQHRGTVVSSTNWTFEAYSASPGIPGDSGSGVMLGDGGAAGVLVTVESVYPAANGVTKLPPALAFAADHGVSVELVTWDQLSGPLA